MKVDFYCWVKWNTCKKAKEFLSQKGIEINDRDFFKNLLNRTEIEDLLQVRSASEMFNFRSPSFKNMGLDREKLGNDELIKLMLKEPRLVRRPVIRILNEVHFGANSKRLAEILDWLIGIGHILGLGFYLDFRNHILLCADCASESSDPPPVFLLPHRLLWLQLVLPFFLGAVIGLVILRKARLNKK